MSTVKIRFEPWSMVAWVITVLAVVAMLACVQPVKPETPKQKLTMVEYEFSAVALAATDLINAGMFSDDAVMEIQGLILAGNDTLNLAWAAIGKGAPEKADEFLPFIQGILMQLRPYLEVKDGPAATPAS